MKRVSLALIALFLVGCRFATDTPPTSVPATFPVSEAIDPGTYELQFGSQGESRNVIVHIPPQYDGSAELPLLIVLHGGGGSGEQIQRLSEMDTDADEYGFIVAYPDGSGRLAERLFTWNSGHCCGYAFENNTDDVAFIGLLIDRLVGHYAIDPDRVYITGISNGAMMAYWAGAELADKVAGIAPIAGSIGGQVNESSPTISPSSPALPIAVIAFHGKQDQHVLYDGGLSPKAVIDGRIDISVADSIAFWVQANGCDPLPETEERSDGNINIETYTNCDEGADVVLVTILDGGHAWPGARERLVGDDATQDISANEMMLEFFLSHPKQR